MCLPFGMRYSSPSNRHAAQRDATLVLVVACRSGWCRLLRDDRRILRTTRLEQLRHPRQTAGDVAGLGAFGRDTGQHVAEALISRQVDRDDGVGAACNGPRRHGRAWRSCRRARARSAPDAESEVRADERQSMTTRLLMPVDSSSRLGDRHAVDQVLEADEPSTSARIGREYGSHSIRRWPRLIVALVDPQLRPYWTR
jgi:hypothetical protein